MSCKRCGNQGHNIRTCKNEPDVSEVTPEVVEYIVSPRKRQPELTAEEYADKVEQQHPGIVSMLSKLSDTAIARLYGLSRSRVFQHRKRLEVVSRSEVRNSKPLTQQEIDLIGTMPDGVLAEKLNITTRRVKAIRALLNVPPYERVVEKSVLYSVKDRLCKESDGQIAQELGLGLSTVRNFRYKHLIAAYVQTNRGHKKGVKP